MEFDYTNIPVEMKEQRRWVLWKRKKVDNKTTKIPVNAKNGYGAKSNDDTTWVTFAEALSKVDFYNCNGLGFMLGGGYFGIDLDNENEKKKAAGEITQEECDKRNKDFKKVINEFVDSVDSYTEISQSGVGIHIICKGYLPEGARRKGNIEMYDSARFFAMTGRIYKRKNYINDCTESVKPIYQKYLGKKEQEAAYVFHRETKTIGLLTDNEVIEKAKNSKSGNLFVSLYDGNWEGSYESQSQADMALCSMLAFWCCKDADQMDRIFRNSGLYRDKWDEKRGRLTYGEITINQAIKTCKDVYNISFNNNVQNYNTETGQVGTIIQYDLNDTGNAKRFVDRFGENVRFNCDNNEWYIFDGKTWARDTKQLVKTQADIMLEEMKAEAYAEEDKDTRREKIRNVNHLASANGKEAMLKEAKHISFIPTINKDYNKNDYLLNCENGVIDLKTGELLPHDKNLMMSKNTHISCEFGEPKRWNQFLLEVFGGNEEMVEYTQRAVGMTLTGDTREQCFFQCYGDGANGKSVFLDVLYNIMGDYSLNSQVESILARNNSSSGASSEIARMDGARFVRTNEPNDNSRFNEGLLKQLVAGDVTTARYLYGREFEFKPKFKLWIATNYKIGVRGTDNGIWRRMRLFPFEQRFDGDKADKMLPEKLKAEYPQILGWAVIGAIKWQKDGLKTPKEIEKATNAYKNEMDVLASFLKECVREEPEAKEKASDVYKAYAQWTKESGEYCMSKTKFTIEMSKRYEKKMVSGYAKYYGFILNEHDKSYTFIKED